MAHKFQAWVTFFRALGQSQKSSFEIAVYKTLAAGINIATWTWVHFRKPLLLKTACSEIVVHK